MILVYVYHNDQKFSDRKVWAYSVDPVQTAQELHRCESVFAILSSSFGKIIILW